MNDISLLKKLLNKSSEDEIVEDAVTYYVDHGLPPQVRDVYRKFLDVAASNQPALETSNNGHGGDVQFVVVREARDMRFNPTKTRGRIMQDLMNHEKFTRAYFRGLVAAVMGWSSAAKKFSISTKFRSLDEAERAWWNTLKGRDKLITESR